MLINRQEKKKEPPRYMKQEFYFRSGVDPLKEEEYIEAEYRTALAEYRKVIMQRDLLRKEISKYSEILEEKEGYTAALNMYLDDKDDTTQEESKMKKDLTFLESFMLERESELHETRAMLNPIVAGTLKTEKQNLLNDIQKLETCLEEKVNGDVETLNQLCACYCSEQYFRNKELELKYSIVKKKNKYLRDTISEIKRTIDSLPSISIDNSSNSVNQRNSMLALLNKKCDILRAKYIQRSRGEKHSQYINLLFSYIEELNDRMRDLGFDESELTDISAIKEAFTREYDDVAEKSTKYRTESREQRKEEKRKRSEQLYAEDQKRVRRQKKELEKVRKREKERRERERKQLIEQKMKESEDLIREIEARGIKSARNNSYYGEYNPEPPRQPKSGRAPRRAIKNGGQPTNHHRDSTSPIHDTDQNGSDLAQGEDDFDSLSETNENKSDPKRSEAGSGSRDNHAFAHEGEDNFEFTNKKSDEHDDFESTNKSDEKPDSSDNGTSNRNPHNSTHNDDYGGEHSPTSKNGHSEPDSNNDFESD